MTPKPKINEKMQPKLKASHRHWQHFNQGDYYYGQCPLCDNSCQLDDMGYKEDDEHVTVEYAECEECGCCFYVETTTVYRFGGLEEDE